METFFLELIMTRWST